MIKIIAIMPKKKGKNIVCWHNFFLLILVHIDKKCTGEVIL